MFILGSEFKSADKSGRSNKVDKPNKMEKNSTEGFLATDWLNLAASSNSLLPAAILAVLLATLLLLLLQMALAVRTFGARLLRIWRKLASLYPLAAPTRPS